MVTTNLYVSLGTVISYAPSVVGTVKVFEESVVLVRVTFDSTGEPESDVTEPLTFEPVRGAFTYPRRTALSRSLPPI